MGVPKILTFNWHEPYICLLAKTGCQFDVIELYKGGRFGWIREFREVPENCRLISEEEGLNALSQGKYDLVICHNTGDFAKVSEYDTRKIIIHHNNFFIETGIGDLEKKRETIRKLREVYAGTKGLTLVFISEMKRRDWELEGEVILPGIDPEEFCNYRGDIERVLRVGNGLKERDIMLGYSIQEKILSGLPSSILGINPTLEGAKIPENFDQYREYLRSHRVFINTTLYPYEDGYNLSMLEAMATGMPVVSYANPTSPVVDGINGFVSEDTDYLREVVEELLSDREKARRLGRKARETVIDLFPIDEFIRRWKDIFGVEERKKAARPVRVSHEDMHSETPHTVERFKVLMCYVSNPQTTAAYLERALKERHEVVTFGPSITDPIWQKDILKEWKLEPIKDRVRPHDIPLLTEDVSEVVEKLKEIKQWVPDLFFFVDTGIWFPIYGLERIPSQKACYLIDVHLDLERRIEFAKGFDWVFIAQRQYIGDFKRAGIENVFWLPLGCDPDIHGRRPVEKIYDIGFVGSLNNPKRIELVNKLSERFNFHHERCFLEDMSRVYSQSRIVFNISVKDDLNMRVFEGLCSGSMLLTDEARGSGLTELFEDRKHLVVYRDENELMELADYYLRNETEREAIAEAGRREAVEKHTYGHRVEEMIEIIRGNRQGSTLTAPSEKVAELSAISEQPHDLSYYSQERKEVQSLVPPRAKRILDVGCGTGTLGKSLLATHAQEVVGVEVLPEVAEVARENLSRVLCGDIEEIELPYEEGYFDCIICADLLEHLVEPEKTLKKLKRYLSETGSLIISVPNVRYYQVINMLVEGRWHYDDAGIMDRTHLRFFTRKEMEEMLDRAGFRVTALRMNIDPAYEKLERSQDRVSFGRVSIEGLKPHELTDLFVFQYIMRATHKETKTIRKNEEKRELSWSR